MDVFPVEMHLRRACSKANLSRWVSEKKCENFYKMEFRSCES